MLGLRVLKSTDLQELTRRSIESESKVLALGHEIDALQARHGAVQEEYEKLRRQHDQLLFLEQAQRARIDWLSAAFHKSLWQHQLINDLIQGAVSAQVSRQNGVEGPRAPRKTAIVVLTAVSQITQLAALASSQHLRNEYDLVVVGFADVARPDIVELCRRARISLLSHDLKLIVGALAFFNEMDEPGADYETTLAGTDYPDAEKACMREIVRLAAETRRQTKLSGDARNLLRHTHASVVVCFEDNAEYVTGIWIAIARELSVPSVIMPYTIADQLEPAEAHYNDVAYWAENGIHNRLAKTVAPHWLFFHRDRWLLRRSGLSVLAAESLGVAPPLPWILNSSKANAIAVESEAMRQHYLAQGIPETQLVMTGSLTDDLLHEARQKRELLRKELGLDSRPVLLCSFPPNQLTTARTECEFADFHALVDFWLGELGRLQWQVVVKPHPAMRAEDIEYMRKHDIRIVTEHDTTSLLPLCDLYNPSVSSTIRWALACGKPVLNYDVYRYRYQDFVSEPAVRTVFDATQFSAELKRLTEDAEALRVCSDQASAAAGRWGMIDGRSMERILGLLGTLTEHRNQSTSLS